MNFLTGLEYGNSEHFSFDNLDKQRYLCVKESV